MHQIIPLSILLYFFFFKQKTAYEMRISDWSSDVCSSDLASPAPAYNFAFTPRVQDQDAWFDMKRRGHTRPLAGYLPIHMPKNTPAGIVLAGLDRKSVV